MAAQVHLTIVTYYRQTFCCTNQIGPFLLLVIFHSFRLNEKQGLLFWACANLCCSEHKGEALVVVCQNKKQPNEEMPQTDGKSWSPFTAEVHICVLCLSLNDSVVTHSQWAVLPMSCEIMDLQHQKEKSFVDMLLDPQ